MSSTTANLIFVFERHSISLKNPRTRATFDSIQKPMKLGADVVLHSATKYLNGHSDALCGVVLTDNEALKNKLVWMQEGTSMAVHIGVVWKQCSKRS